MSVMPETEKPGVPPQRYCNERGVSECVPGANGHGPMHDLGRFYEMLLGGGRVPGAADSAPRILQESSVEMMTSPQRVGMYDLTFRHIMDWGLGLILSSNRYGADTVPYGYGPDCSDRAFGHGGSQSSSAFADPEYGLVVASAMNGMPGEAVHDARMRAFHAVLYQDLGLA